MATVKQFLVVNPETGNTYIGSIDAASIRASGYICLHSPENYPQDVVDKHAQLVLDKWNRTPGSSYRYTLVND